MRFVGTVFLAVGLLGILSAQDEDPVTVLMHLRDRIGDQGNRIPNHTCIETVERATYLAPPGPQPKSCDALLGRWKPSDVPKLQRLDITDRLRLDVGISNGHEIYSWAGAKQFSESEIYDFVPEGAIGTGSFASLLLSLFESPNPQFSFDGEAEIGGRRLFEYSFLKPQADSHYRIRAGSGWVFSGYTAVLLVDMQTGDLARLTIRTDELPFGTSLCELGTTLDYRRLQLSGGDYLLPSATIQRFIGRDGAEGENRIGFTSCRVFQGESKVEFGKLAPDPDPPASAAPAPTALVPGLAVSVDLAEAIDTASAAAGDRVEGRLARSVAGIPAGAHVEGRLLEVWRRHSDRPDIRIALRWETLEWNGVAISLNLLPDFRRYRGIAQNSARTYRMPVVTLLESPLKNEHDYEVYHFPVARPIVPAGLRTEWVTGKP
jgi:hypothetical protein